MTLTQLQAITGTLSITIDGSVKTAASLNLSAATSFSNAATIIGTALSLSGGQTCAYNSTFSAFVITSGTSGASSTITVATGTTSAALALTVATGVTLSQGDLADTPSTAMNTVVASTQNWATYTTTWEPITADKLSFGLWTSQSNQRYTYIAWDTDANAIVANASTTFGAQVFAAAYDGVVPIYRDVNVAAFLMGAVASVDFTRTNARVTFAFKSQSGLTATVTDQQQASNLLGNGYNYYGAYATANDQFTFLYNGQISGKWKFIDPYVDQIYLNSQFQLALLSLLTSAGSVPYTQAGNDLIRAACMDPINQGLNSGIIRAGVPLSAQQAALVNSAAGASIDGVLTERGWYLQILLASAQTRGTRSSPPMTFWYTDGGAVQSINLASIDVL
jgi:hypothetical protein